MGGILRRPLQRKQRKHRTFLTLFLYTILKYLFIKILCFRCSWPINGVIKPFVAAQKLHKTCTNCTELPPAAATPLHLYPHLAPKLHPNVQPKPPRHGLTAQNLFSVKPKKKTRPILPQPQSGKSVFFCGRKQPGAMRKRARKGRKGMVVASSPIGLAFHPSNLTASGSQSFAGTRGGDSKGRSPWRAFGDFPRDGKVTRGWRGGAPSP